MEREELIRTVQRLVRVTERNILLLHTLEERLSRLEQAQQPKKRKLIVVQDEGEDEAYFSSNVWASKKARLPIFSDAINTANNEAKLRMTLDDIQKNL